MKMDGRTTRIRFKVDGLENERIISQIEIVFFFESTVGFPLK